MALDKNSHLKIISFKIFSWHTICAYFCGVYEIFQQIHNIKPKHLVVISMTVFISIHIELCVRIGCLLLPESCLFFTIQLSGLASYMCDSSSKGSFNMSFMKNYTRISKLFTQNVYSYFICHKSQKGTQVETRNWEIHPGLPRIPNSALAALGVCISKELWGGKRSKTWTKLSNIESRHPKQFDDLYQMPAQKLIFNSIFHELFEVPSYLVFKIALGYR